MNFATDKLRSIIEALCASISAHSALINIDKVKSSVVNGYTAEDILTKEEKKLYDGCRVLKRKSDWLSGRIAAKLAVAKLLGQPPSQMVEILRRESGAPYVSGCQHVSVSISHSGQVAVAVAAPHKIGIDLELLESRPESLLRAVLSTRERSFLADREGDDLVREVNRLWTCKEAVSKVHQWGGSVNFKMIDCCNNPVSINGESIYYKCRNSEMYAVTLAYEGYRGE